MLKPIKLSTVRIVRGKDESEHNFYKRYDEKMKELNFHSATISKDSVDINFNY